MFEFVIFIHQTVDLSYFPYLVPVLKLLLSYLLKYPTRPFFIPSLISLYPDYTGVMMMKIFSGATQ